MATKLKKYQRKGVKKIERFNGRVLLADEMGLGKTIQALTYIKRHPELRPVVVICPATLKWVWELQAKRHVGLRATILNGTKPQEHKNIITHNNFLILNYEIVQGWLPYLIKLKPKILIIDECHYQKSSKAKRTKAIHKLVRQVNIPHVIAISGTPLTNRPAELFTTLHLLWPMNFPTFHAFGWRYCKPKRRPWGWEFNGASHLDELHESLLNLGMIRRLKKDVLTELPDKIRQVIPCSLKRIKEYEEAQRDFISWLRKESAVKADKAAQAEAITKLGYLKRFAAKLKMGFVKKWVDDFLEREDGKLVLFCTHRKIIRKLHKRYKEISVVVDGSVTGKKRKYAIEQFQTNKKTRIFIGNIKAAGVGIDLWAASVCAFVELDWVPGNHTQAEDRLHRIGQKKVVMVYYLIAKKTIEEKLCKIIQQKQEVLTNTLDGKKVKNDFNVFSKLQKILLKKAS